MESNARENNVMSGANIEFGTAREKKRQEKIREYMNVKGCGS